MSWGVSVTRMSGNRVGCIDEILRSSEPAHHGRLWTSVIRQEFVSMRRGDAKRKSAAEEKTDRKT